MTIANTVVYQDFQADHRDIELLKLRNFTTERKVLADNIFIAEDGQQQIADFARAMFGFVGHYGRLGLRLWHRDADYSISRRSRS